MTEVHCLDLGLLRAQQYQCSRLHNRSAHIALGLSTAQELSGYSHVTFGNFPGGPEADSALQMQRTQVRALVSELDPTSHSCRSCPPQRRSQIPSAATKA